MEREEIERALDYCHSEEDNLKEKHAYEDELFFGERRILVGAYIKGDIRINFYYKPSFYSRMKMYWIFGWSWEDVKA